MWECLSRDLGHGLAPARKREREQKPKHQPRHHSDEHPGVLGHSRVPQQGDSEHAGEENAESQPENARADHDRRGRVRGEQRRQHGGDGERSDPRAGERQCERESRQPRCMHGLGQQCMRGGERTQESHKAQQYDGSANAIRNETFRARLYRHRLSDGEGGRRLGEPANSNQHETTGERTPRAGPVTTARRQPSPEHDRRRDDFACCPEDLAHTGSQTTGCGLHHREHLTLGHRLGLPRSLFKHPHEQRTHLAIIHRRHERRDFRRCLRQSERSSARCRLARGARVVGHDDAQHAQGYSDQNASSGRRSLPTQPLESGSHRCLR